MNAIVGILNDIASLWAGQMWTIIWQSTVLAGLVVIVTLLFRRLSAAVKFWLWMLVPLRLLVMPLITISLPLLPAIAPPHIEHMKTAPAVVEKAPVEYSPVRMANFEFPQEALNFQTRPVEIREQETEPDIIRIKLNLWFFLLITWFAGVGFWTIRLFWSWRKIRLIVGNAKKTEHQRIIRQASKAAAIAGLKNVPEILVTRGNISPFLFGILRPVLIVPSDFVNNVSNEGLLAVFSHEFAHLRRKDTLVGWILAICEAFYFFHPVLHFAKRRILFERERACDDWVIASGNSHKKIYANALIDAAGICRNFSAKLGPTGVVAESFGDLKKRIIAIGSNIKPKTRLSKTALVLLILTGTICVPGFVLTNRTIASSEKATLETVREMVARNEALINPIKMEYTVKYERKGELPSLNTGGGMRGSGRLSTYSEHTWAQDGKKNYSKGQNFYGPNEPSRGEIYIFDDKVTAFGALPDLMRGEIRDHDRFDWYFVLVVKLGLRPFEGEFRLNEILVPDYATLNNKTEIISGRETYVVDAGWPPHSLYFARIWIDKQRGMPLRIWYYKEHPTRTSQKTMSEINNIELYQLPNGAWLPIKGTRSNNLTSYISYEHISVDVNSVTTKRDDIPESLFEIDFPDGARVHNVFTGFISIKGKQLKTYEEIVGGTGSYIAGTIVDANDAAVPDVVVRPQTIRVEQSDGRSNYRILQPEEVSCAVTDSQGRFAVELNEEGIYEFDIYPKDLSEASVRVPLGEHNLKIVLEKGGTIKGRVVSLKKGRKIPLPNIEVEVESERFVTLRTNRLKAVTDSDGRFEIKYLSTHLSPRTDNPQEYRPRPWQIHCGSHTQTVVFEEGVSNKEVEILLRPDIDSAAPLTGKSLPSFDEIKLDYDINQAKDKKVLICFFDLEQRPARNCLLELSKQADDLAQQGISVIAVHASEIGKDILDAWLKENNITIPVGIVEGDEQQLRFNWAIQSLPWLILTDWKHIVRFEGFSIDELNDKIQECSEWDVIEGYVRDPNGKPIENVEVRIDRDSPEYYPPEITQTDEHGYYSIPKPEWSYTILSQWTEILDSNDGQRRQMIKLKRIFDGPQTINFQFNSFPDEDTILGGKVVDNSDNPVSDYKIWIIDSDYRDDPNKDYICKFDYTLEKTFESGIFRITGLSPGDYHISVFPKSKTYEETVFLDVTLENNKVSDNTIRLNSKKAFYGRVLFEDGSPAILPDLKTDITEPMGEASWATLASLDNDGYFEVLLSEREIQEFQTSKKQLWVLLKRYHIGMFPFDLLTPEHDKAKIVKVNRPEVVIEPENVLVGKLLPELKNFGIDLSLFDMKDKKVLVCFFDSEQRPARNCLLELSKRADDLARQGISIIAVHASKIEKNTLDTWLKENNITMPVGIVEDDSEQIRFNWAIQSLPWLILTNTKHIVTDDGFSIDEIEEKIKNINENPALETINSKELLENLKSMDEIYTSSLTLTGTDIRIPDYPDVPRQKIRWKISMHQDEFALEQISDEIYERKSSQPVDGLLGTPSMMMKAVVYMSKQRGGHHYIFGKVLEPGKAPEPEDNMISGQVIINKTDPNYFIVSKIRYLWSIGRYYSNYIDRIVEVSTGNNGIMTVTAAGQMTDKIQGQWELQINPAAMYMVQNAKFTRFDSEGQLSETPEIIINNSGVKWFENLCIPQETSFTGLGNNVNVPINYELISQKADLEFIKQANEFLDPPYNVQTTHSIISGSANFDSMYEAGETKANANGGNDTKDSFFDELLYLRQRNPSTFGIPALIEAYEKFISKYQEYPRIAEALFELANIYESSWDGHDSNKAMELFETAAKTAAPNTDIWKKANIYWFNRLINSDIQNAENILLNMKNHLRENDYVLEAEIEDRYVYFYGIQKRFDEAEKHYAKVLALYNDREKTTENIKDRITIEDCYRTSSQTLLASINNAIDLTPAQRLALIREIGNKHNLFTIFNFYDETIKQLESQVSWQDMSVELKKQESVDNEDSTDLDFAKREISGFVEDKNGNPIGSASIELLNKELVLLPEPVKIGDKTVKVITQNYETGTLKKDGSFKISELNPGKTDILIKAANYQTKIVKDIPTGTENLKIILDQPKAYKLSGKVTDSKGNPIKDVQITLAQDTDKPILTKVKTNDKGLFEFEELLGPLTEIASQLLLAQKDGFGMYGKYLDTTGFESYVEITLLPEEKATGRVVNEKGKPVPGAEVMVWSLHGKQSSFIFRRAWQDIAPKVKTDSNGKFVLPALAEKCDFDILAVADGYAYSQETYSTGQYDDYGRSMESGGILVGGGNPRTEGELEFVLKKPVTLSGTVTYEKTKLPVEGVKVVYCAMEFSPGGNECVTDKDGKFVLENIYPSPGNLCVLLERPSENTLSEWTAAAIQFENLKSGQTKENLKLVLVKGGIISGKVTDSSGNPLKDIAIHFFSAARPPRYNVPNYEFMHSDENGLWSYRFPPGEVYVWVITRIKDANWYKVKSSKKVKNSYMEITSVYSTKIKSGQEIKDINIKLDKELPENSIYR